MAVKDHIFMPPKSYIIETPITPYYLHISTDGIKMNEKNILNLPTLYAYNYVKLSFQAYEKYKFTAFTFPILRSNVNING